MGIMIVVPKVFSFFHKFTDKDFCFTVVHPLR